MNSSDCRPTHSQPVTRRIREFTYVRPVSIEDAVSAIGKQGDKVKVLAGGTDLLPMMKLGMVTPETLVSLSNIRGLDNIREEGKTLRIGALTTITALLASDVIREKVHSLYDTALGFATPQIRNMATIGGNICRSSPCANTPPPLMTLNAELKLVGANGERNVLLEDFFMGSGENALNGEVLEEIIVPLPEERSGTAFAQLTRNSSDLAKINCAVRITVDNDTCEDIRIVLGSAADRPVRATKTEQLIKGEKIRDKVIEAAVEKVTENIDPISDARSDADYRMQVSKVLVARTVKKAVERIKKA